MPLVYVKEDIPLEVHGTVSWGGSNYHGSDEPPWVEVDVTDVCCANTGEEVTSKFKASLSREDWEAIEDAILEAAY